MDITFKTKDNPEQRKVSFDMPENLQGLIEKFGEETVYSNAVGAFVISLQALARRHIEKSDEEIQELVTNWNPNVRSPAVKQTALEKAKSALKQMSAEDRAALLASLQAG